MRTIIWFIRFWIYLIAVIPKRSKARKLLAQGDIEAHDALVREVVGKWARNMLSNAGATVKVTGLENLPDGPAVYVGNHLGYFDIPLCLGYLGSDTKPLLAKKEIQKIPLIRDWMHELHCVFIDRHNPRASVLALNEAADWVKQGYSMVVFPEGTRSPDGELQEFKGGAFRIAQKSGVPVVPFRIEDSDKLMPKGALRIRPAEVSIQVLPVIDTSLYERGDWKALPELCRSVIVDAAKSCGRTMD